MNEPPRRVRNPLPFLCRRRIRQHAREFDNRAVGLADKALK